MKLKVIKVPADPGVEATQMEVETVYSGLKELLGGWVENVSTRFTVGEDRLCFIVDEEGALKRLPHNRRASSFYPGDIYGDAYFLLEGWVNDPEEGRIRDFKSLPEDFGTEDLRNLIDPIVSPSN